ncbi:unnamed protein product, partial [Clonostachys rhizophaga]
MPDEQITHDLIGEAVDLYFAKVFYWIPLIHRSRFKDQIKSAEGRRRLGVVIDAILIATLRFVDRDKHSLSEDGILRLTTEKRKSVLIAAMDSLSIENLQALVILAFTDKTDKSSTHPSDHPRSDIPGDAGSPVLSSESTGGSWLGGFAYCIEATEYLRRISTFVFHQDVDFASQKDVRSWLTRFKELDLQLVHWKMFLPRKWSDPNRAPNTSTGPRDLDHNMTLAHVTHNTSMILLHHRIAYPPVGWCHSVPLPSACSAETCRLAATKTSNIMEKWLSICPEEIIVAPQMALCTFVSARLLILHWRNDAVGKAQEQAT